MDNFSKEQRSKTMRAIKSSRTKIEQRLAKALWARGLRYRRNDKTVFGTPDFVFKGVKVAVFCDSEFFHGKDWEAKKIRLKTNREFWINKIENNIKRDRLVNSTLANKGWKVLRFWGEDINKRLDFCAGQVQKEVEGRKQKKHILYTELRDRLDISPDNEKDNDLAFLTHYWQNSESEVSQCFAEPAAKYLTDNNRVKAEVFKPLGNLPITWDIPFPPVDNPGFIFIDLFAGIGGFRVALQNAGGKCAFSSETDMEAQKTYELNFGEVPFGNIKRFTSCNVGDEELDRLIPDHDLLAAGFSSVGYPPGNFDSEDGCIENLFSYIMRIVKVKKPCVLFFENVKSFKSNGFQSLGEAIRAEGYDFLYSVIDSETGGAHKCKRTYMVAFYGDDYNFIFPNFDEEPVRLKRIMGKPSGTVSGYYKEGEGYMIMQGGKNPRKLTPCECARLLGYPESFILPENEDVAYRLLGDSLSVIQKIANAIVKIKRW